MSRRLSMSLAVSLLCFAPCVAGAAANYPRHEVWLGFGAAASFERNVFNTPNDVASKPEVAISLGYMMNLDARRAVGFHLYGGSEITSPILLQGPAVSRLAQFELNTYNLGVRYRRYFPRGAFVPYAFGGANMAFGGTSGGGLGDLFYSGVSACAGPGASMRFGRNFMLSAEGIASFGVANWKHPPSAGSSGTKFNPSLAGGTLNLGVVWGSPPAPQIRIPTPVVKDTIPAVHGVASQVIIGELCILLYSAAAFDNETGTLPGLTLGGGLLGLAAGQDWKSPKSPWIMLTAILAISTAEFVMGANGASQVALFITSVASWNVVALVVAREERMAGTGR